MNNYYSKKLHTHSLKLCYEVASPRVKQFLQAEIDFVLEQLSSDDIVLDLGCGYGRVAKQLIEKADKVIGIDISEDNIKLAKDFVSNSPKCEFLQMDAANLSFPDNHFDITVCVQNGVSAFKVDPTALLRESIRVTKRGGKILYSSYSDKFWDHRLEWFQQQADKQLLGEIDMSQTKDGVIVCKDGFKAVTYSEQDFENLTSQFDIKAKIIEVDQSSLFCVMEVI
ncbi:MAG: class I SAM-dependent methyltransferase [Hyphomicrobiales bacterium]